MRRLSITVLDFPSSRCAWPHCDCIRCTKYTNQLFCLIARATDSDVRQTDSHTNERAKEKERTNEMILFRFSSYTYNRTERRTKHNSDNVHWQMLLDDTPLRRRRCCRRCKRKMGILCDAMVNKTALCFSIHQIVADDWLKRWFLVLFIAGYNCSVLNIFT